MNTNPHNYSNTSRLIRLPHVLTRVALSRSHVYQLMDRGLFPLPVKIGTRAVAWVEDEISMWIAERTYAIKLTRHRSLRALLNSKGLRASVELQQPSA